MAESSASLSIPDPRSTRTRCAVGLFLLALGMGSPLAGQQRPTIPAEDYGRFELLLQPVLAPRGDWVAYGIRRVDQSAELRVQGLERDTTFIEEWGTTPRFSPTGDHVAWARDVSPEERSRLEEEGMPLLLDATVLELDSGSRRSFAAVRDFQFDATGRFLALHGHPPEEPEGRSGDLKLLELATGTVTTFGNVAEFSWAEVGALLAMAVATGTDEGNGVHVFDAAGQRLRVLDASGSSYRRLAWRRGAPDLAVLRSSSVEGADSTAHTLLTFRDAASDSQRGDLDVAAASLVISSPTPAAAPSPTARTLEDATWMLPGHAAPRWADDGSAVEIGLRPPPPPAAASDSTELPRVQIWHTSDVRIVPAQQVQRATNARRTVPAVWTLGDDRVVLAGSDVMENATVLGSWTHGVEKVAAPYPWGAMFGRRYHDVWVTDLATGERTLALERVRYSWESPGGRYLLSFDGEHYWTHDVRSGDRVNITAALPTQFADTEYDTPTDLLPPHGVAGWLADDEGVLLNDAWDVWRVAPDGSRAARLTRGAEDEVVHRVVRLDTPTDAIDPEARIHFSLYGRWTKQRGYARMLPGEGPERLLLEDEHVSQLVRADSADVFLFRREARDRPPRLFAAAGDFSDARPVVNTNPFADEYAWGRAELVDFTSDAGVRLQGTLLYPAHHDPERTYPMIVYAYELLTPQMHLFQAPSERSYYNYTAWTQNGYFVLLPDIVFRARDPGVSLLEAVHPAVRSVVDRGLVDEARVGFVGHSWGGYHATYIATHSNAFAASVAGAPLTDFLSFMGQIHWNTGTPEPDHWETGQARMEVPYWEDREAHFRNSPIERVHEMETPLLMAHGDQDRVVEFFQATVFYNFARRAGKQMVLLVYEDEDHSFQQQANQVDYHRRILEWFGHYLKGESAPSWITDGIPLDAHPAETLRLANPGPEPDGVTR